MELAELRLDASGRECTKQAERSLPTMSINGGPDSDPWSRLSHSSNTSPTLNQQAINSYGIGNANANTSTNNTLNNGNSNMDSELASIVSSLSALSNSNHQHPQHGVQHSQLGGYRRPSISASSNNQDIDIDIESIYSGSLQQHQQQHQQQQNRATLSVGTAPPYTKHRSAADNNAKLLHNHYSASIAGPILFTKTNDGGGFFEKFGKSLIEGTRELESSSVASEPQTQENNRRESITSEASDTSPHVLPKNIWNVAQAPVFKPNTDAFNQYPLPIQAHYADLPKPADPQQPFFYLPDDIYQHQQHPPQPQQRQHQHQQQEHRQHQQHQHQPMPQPRRSQKPLKKQQSNPYLETATTLTSGNKQKRTPKPSNNLSSPPPKQPTVTTRSPLLEEFRANPTNKVYALKDIIGYVLEFCKDQHGSRFIQHELSRVSNSEREVIFNEIRDHAVELSDDVFGNYVIQKFFEFGSKTQKDVLVNQFKGKMRFLSMKMYSCRVIQKSLEFIDLEQRIELVNELSSCILQMIKDQNGNHVIQKSIERIPMESLPFILESLDGQIYHLSTHSYGCRVIQRLLEFGQEADQSRILNELKDFIPYLIQDQYGNYVIQHILQQNDKNSFDEMIDVKQHIIDIVSKNVVEFSKHKFASNVVEKAILFGSVDQKRIIMLKILPVDEHHARDLEDNSPLILMMKDQFANYVVQKLVGVSKGGDQKLIVIAIRSYLDKLNKSDSMGNRHLASVEKLASLVENVKI